MRKSPWAILIMGVFCCAALVVMSQYYLRQSPVVSVRDGLEREFQISDVTVRKSQEGDGYTVAYSCDPRLAENPRALERNMREVAEFVVSRTAVRRVHVIAKTSETDSHELIYPSEPPPARPDATGPRETPPPEAP